MIAAQGVSKIQTPALLLGAIHTGSRSLLSKVASLVTAEETLALNLRGGTTGKLLVEADDTLHAQCVGSAANSL